MGRERANLVSRAADEVIGVYARHALAWSEARGAQLIELSWFKKFSDLLSPAAAVLDLGCGSGLPTARYLLERGFSVTGVDSAPEMIALFRINLPGQATMLADMRALHLERRFSGLLAWDSLFHLSPDHQRTMFAIFKEHAQADAALMFTSGPAFGESMGTLEGEPLYHASLDGAEYRALLQEHGFTVVDQMNEDPSCGSRTVWLAQYRPAR